MFKIAILGSLGRYTSFRRNYRRTRPEVSCKKDVLRNFTKFTAKHLCQSLFFNNVAGLRTTFLTQCLFWLLLKLTFTEFQSNFTTAVEKFYCTFHCNSIFM